jgi:hypothetical protein
VRSLLRWSSLVVAAGILYVVGERRVHLHDFNVFIMIVLALALAIIAVFAATASRDGERDRR